MTSPIQKDAQSALSRLFRRRSPSVPAAQPVFIPAPLDADGLPNLEPDTATFQTAYPNISQGLGAARPNNAPTGGAQELARERYWQNALSAPAQAAVAAVAPKLPATAAPKLPAPAAPVVVAVRKPASLPATARPVAPARPAVAATPGAPAVAKPPAPAPLVKRYKPMGQPGSGSTSVVSGMYAADAPGTYASLDEAKASYSKASNPPVATAKAPTQGPSPMKKASVDHLNRLGAQLKCAQADQDIRDEFANPHQGPVRKPSYIPPKSPSLLSQLGSEATWAGESAVGRGAAVGAAAGAGFNALRTAVGNIRRKKKGEPTKSVVGGALTGGLVGGGLGAGAGYAMKQAEVQHLNRLGTHLRTPAAK